MDNKQEATGDDFVHKFNIRGTHIVTLNALRSGSAKATHEQEIRFRIIEQAAVTADLTLNLPADPEGIKKLAFYI